MEVAQRKEEEEKGERKKGGRKGAEEHTAIQRA